MSKQSLIEQLDQAIERMLIRPDAVFSSPETQLAALLQAAGDLRDLPNPDFKARLKADLERRAFMTKSAVKPIREGFHTITPYVMVPEAAELIEFVKRAFGAEELFRTIGSAGGIHAEVRIGDSMVMIGGGGTWQGKPMPTAFHLYVEKVDEAYGHAVAAGAVPVKEPVDQFYGDREACVRDAAGNNWYIATHQGARYVPEGLRSVTPYLHPTGTPKLIEFLKQAFGAEEVGRAQSPDGVVHHAKIRIGDSIIEMGEAHDQWQPMPTAIYLYLPDVDTIYRRALEAGATSLSLPMDQPYGDRNAGVEDPFGNQWFIATHQGIVK